MKEYIITEENLSGIQILLINSFKELVRCKDCKHRPTITGEYENGFDVEFPDWKCPCRCDDGWYNWMPDDNWFCGNGERKEE